MFCILTKTVIFLDFLSQSQPIDIKQLTGGYVEVLGQYSLEDVQPATNLASQEIKKETLPLPGRTLSFLWGAVLMKCLYSNYRFPTSLDESILTEEFCGSNWRKFEWKL